MRSRTTTWGLAAVALAVAALAAGCGGSKQETTPATDWADGLCTAITTWRSSLNATIDSVQSSTITTDSLKQAADEANQATDTFIASLKKLGKPDTDAGSQAKADVDQLSTQIADGKQSIETSVKGVQNLTDIFKAAPDVLSTLQTMTNEVKTTVSDLQQLDPKGELKSAFDQAPACKSITSST